MLVIDTSPDDLSHPKRLPSALLHKLLLNTRHGVVMTDAQRRITWINPAFTQISGYTLDEVIGRNPGAVLQCKSTSPETVQRLRERLNAGQSCREVILNQHRDGTHYWLDLDIQPFGPEGEPPEGYFAIEVDLTFRQLPTQLLRAVVDTTAAGIVVQDENGMVVDCNPAAESLLGLTRDQLMGLTSIDPRWRALDQQGQDLPGERHPAMETLRTGEPQLDVLMGVALPSGGRRWLMINTAILPRAAAAPWVVASFVDVSAGRELEQALGEQWQRLRALLTGSRTGTWEWNVATGEMRIDERWAEIIGWTVAELEPLSAQTWADRLHPDDLPRCEERLNAHFKGATDHYDAEFRMRHRDGSWRWVHARGRVSSRLPGGQPHWCLGTHQDISERKQSEATQARHHGLMQALFERSPLGLQLIDLSRKVVVSVNDALVNMTGYSAQELLQNDGRDRFTQASRSQRDHWAQLALSQGHFGPDEAEYVHKSGHVIRLVFNGVRVSDPDSRDFLWLSVQDVTRQRAMESRLLAAATVDRLTGLANRGQLMLSLEALAERARTDADFRFAVMFLDFDRFKLVNDTLGHDAGDELLRAVGARLREAVETAARSGPGGWLVARFGGDEFVILAPGLRDPAGVADFAENLLLRLSEPYLVKDREIHSGASMGVAFSQGIATEAQALMRDADTAMYEAKRRGRGGMVCFDAQMRAKLTRSVLLDEALRHAIARNQLHVAYQPIVDLETGAMTSVEALLRWQHPELGTVSPGEFIPIAEESGEIIPIGEWVLRQACQDWSAWQAQDPVAAPAMVSVNVSRVQMTLGPRLMRQVRQALAAAAMPASALQLEITEREVMKDPEHARALMHSLRELGVHLAMDDFGTGTSSLGCLRDYPFHTIKIDKSFVTDLCRDPHVLAVAHATVNVIENLGMMSVAEGIEEPGEVAVLQSMGCRYGQGYLFARPMPAGQLLAHLSRKDTRVLPA
jgi:diguanylate cyclase (GGDEF)-like protein/PAS domain S-box-containing protein